MRQNGPLDFEEGKMKVIGCWLDVQPYFVASSKASTGLILPPNGSVTLIHAKFLLPSVSLSVCSLVSGCRCTNKLACLQYSDMILVVKACGSEQGSKMRQNVVLFNLRFGCEKLMFSLLKAIEMAFL